ncbi:PAR15 polymerase, partial [Oreotrochilus melanogaster]|nr:PAR15 polymerase [Oreotrochilus melanogaster]
FFQTDIIVTSVGKDLQLEGGPLSRVLLNKAGPMLQVELQEVGQGKIIEEGSVWKTQSYNLNCLIVLHAVLPRFQKNGSVKIFGNIVTKCLQIAEELSLKSITFPAIGTGRLEYPKPYVAELLFEKVFDFSSKNGINSLQEVHFLLHPKDTDNIQAFNDELENRCGNTVGAKRKKNIQKKSSQGTASSDSSSRTSEDVCEMMFGSILFQVAKGDITQEDTDVIVNITNQSFNLKRGVSRAILDGAGKTVEKECAQLAALADKSYIITRGGNLPCKNIIHFISQNDIKLLVSTVLEECETQKYTSVTFPAIGTGEAGRDPGVVADNIIDSVANFAKSISAPSVKVIKVVIFQPHLVSVFHKNLQRRESYAKTAKSFFSKLANQLSTMLPATWDDQQNQRLRVVELKPDSRDYKDVQEKFQMTCQSFKIEKIERVQNPALWKLYQIKKRDMDEKNGNRNNERLLFHGTSKESITLINKHGFNRSYAGAHAANYGKGTYFAVDAAYSAQDLYSKPDKDGRKYMYLARVLVGEYSQGIKGSITAAAKNANNTLDLYDSSTDNVSRPTMFIIFSDTQAYPEYLITFT